MPYFVSHLFSPLGQRGELEAPICCVIKGLKPYTTTSPLSVPFRWMTHLILKIKERLLAYGSLRLV